MQTFTITFGDVAENHTKMQKIGTLADEGFKIKELKNTKLLFEKKGYECELINLKKILPKEQNENASNAAILVIRRGVEVFVDSKKLFKEHSVLDMDRKALMYGKVVNKKARYNLCFADEAQESDYENGKGRIVAFDSLPLTNKIRKDLPKYFGDASKRLMAEGNYYYDISKCGIGYHGDSERKKVIAIRLGADLPLCYQWFLDSEPVGKRLKLNLKNGDMYIMNEKATGNDWKLRKILTLRHAAGCDKFLKV